MKKIVSGWLRRERVLLNLRMVVSDDRISEILSHAQASPFPNLEYLEWCYERACAGAPMPWEDPHYEIKQQIDRAIGAFEDVARAMRAASQAMREVADFQMPGPTQRMPWYRMGQKF